MIYVVFDATLLISATSFAGATYLDWPRVPPVTGNAEQDAMGVIASSPQFGQDFRLVVNDDILAGVLTGLTEVVGLRPHDARDYIQAVVDLSRMSGGGRVDVAANDPKLLAQSFGAVLVAASSDLLSHRPHWHGVPVIDADTFAGRADAARRLK